MEDKYMEDVGAIADYDSRRTEIGHIKAWNEAAEAAASLVESWTARDIRLAVGEITAQELITVRAAQRWFAIQIREHLCGESGRLQGE
jgi:hypothetical protein